MHDNICFYSVLLSYKHTNANAIMHATADAKIAWLSTHQRDDRRDMWEATTGATQM